MALKADAYENFDDVNARLEQILAAVNDESLPLDAALDLYEEAVALGLRASDLLEEGVSAFDPPVDSGEDAPAIAADPAVDSAE